MFKIATVNALAEAANANTSDQIDSFDGSKDNADNAARRALQASNVMTNLLQPSNLLPASNEIMDHAAQVTTQLHCVGRIKYPLVLSPSIDTILRL